VHWIFAEAERLGRPAVVNLSLGGHWDGHDGEDDLSVGLNEESGPGRIVVAAVGNEGTDPIHARQEVAAGQPAAFTFDVAARSGPTPVPWLVLNGWYEGTGKCEVRVKNSSGQTTPWQGLLSGADAGNAGAMVHVLAGDKVTLSTPDSDNPNGDRQFLVEIDSDPQEPGLQGGRWTLEVRRKSGTPGTVHVWLLAHASLPPTAAAFSPGVAVASELIGSPGAATQVITVAAYTSRNQWVDNQGVARNVGMTLNTLADFSSPGPRRDGQPKPDVTAPGAMICAARSSGANPPTPARYVIGNEHRMNAGTSMACPLITGVVALLLEKNPQLTPDAARAFLKQHSTVPGKPKGTFDPHWGYGLLKLPS
jgi:subtilisin family serine protease